MRYRIMQHKAVWETTSFEVEVPEGVKEEDVKAWAEENYDRLREDAEEDEDASDFDVTTGDDVTEEEFSRHTSLVIDIDVEKAE